MAALSPLGFSYETHRRVVVNRLPGESRITNDVADSVQSRRDDRIAHLLRYHQSRRKLVQADNLAALRTCISFDTYKHCRSLPALLETLIGPSQNIITRPDKSSGGSHPCQKLKELVGHPSANVFYIL